jgi:hypothetical protein
MLIHLKYQVPRVRILISQLCELSGDRPTCCGDKHVTFSAKFLAADLNSAVENANCVILRKWIKHEGRRVLTH